MTQEFSGSFEMINNDIEQDFSASNGTGNEEILLQRFFSTLSELKNKNNSELSIRRKRKHNEQNTS